MVSSRQAGLWVAIGAVYGLSLAVIGVMMAGGGHGTYLLLGLASAPVSLLGFGFSLAGPAILWGVIGALLADRRKKTPRQLLVGLMLLHYLGVVLVFFVGDYAEWKYFEKAWTTNPAVVVVGGSLYLAGQIVIWVCWLRAGSRPQLETEA